MGRKHCGKRRNCSLRANFSFSHSVFKRHVLQTHTNQQFLLFPQCFQKTCTADTYKPAISPFPTVFSKDMYCRHVQTSNFSFSHSVFKRHVLQTRTNQQFLLFPQCFQKTCTADTYKPAISPFPTVFSKDMYCRHVRTRACLGKG